MWLIKFFFLTVIILISASVSYAKVTIPFEGTIDFVEGKLVASIKGAGQDIAIDFSKQSRYHYITSIRLQPLSIGSLQLKSDVNLHLNQVVVDGSLLSSSIGLQSHYTLINGKPVKDLVGDMEWKDEKLLIHLLSIGSFVFHGTVIPHSEKPLNLNIEWDDVELESALNMTRPVEKHVVAQGKASGQMRVVGSWRSPRLTGIVSTYNGFIDDFIFDSINFRFDGQYPKINIIEAILNRPGMVTGNLTGLIDLTDLSKFITQFKALKKAPIIAQQDDQEVGWVYKRITAENELGKSISEMKYFIRRADGMDRVNDDQEGMLGVERRFDF